MEERRRAPRYELGPDNLIVLPATIPVQVMDISVGGALLHVSRPIQAHATGSLRLNVAGVPFRAEIEVQRVTAGSSEPGYRIGTRFVAVSPEDRQIIERFTNQ